MSRYITGNKTLEDKEKQILPKLPPHRFESYMQWKRAAIDVERRNPELDTSINTQFLSDYLDASLRNSRIVEAELTKAKNNGVIPDRRAYAELDRKLDVDFIISQQKKTHGKQATDQGIAQSKLFEAMRGESVPEVIAGQFYNSEKGGMQWGGVIGGALAGFLIFRQMGGMAGGAIGLIVTAIAAVAGAWLVNRSIEKVGNYMGEKKYDRQRQQEAASRSHDKRALDKKEEKEAPAAEKDPISAMAEAARQAQREAIPEYLRAPEQPPTSDNLNPGQTPAAPKQGNNGRGSAPTGQNP
jgi:hypothetical protein